MKYVIHSKVEKIILCTLKLHVVLCFMFSDTDSESQWDRPSASVNHGLTTGYGRTRRSDTLDGRRSFGTASDTAKPNWSSVKSSSAYDQLSLTRPSIRTTYNYDDSAMTDRYGITKSGVGASSSTMQAWNWKTALPSSGNSSDSGTDKTPPAGFDEAHRSWQFISRIIVLLVLLFVVVVIVSYCFVTRSSQLPVDTRSSYKMCSRDKPGDRCKCTSQSELGLVQRMVRELLDALSTRAGDYDCGYRSDTRSMGRSEILQLLDDGVLITADRKAADCLPLIADMCSENDHWGVRVYGSSSDKGFALESVIGRKSIWCRITDSARYIFTVIILTVLFVGVGCGLFVFVRLRRSAADAERQEVLELVEKIVDILRQNAAAASEETAAGQQSVPPYLAILHVRDALIPLHLRRAKRRVWDQAVKFLSAHESRVRVEQQQISGEG